MRFLEVGEHTHDGLEISRITAKAGIALLPYYHDVLKTPNHPLAVSSIGRILRLAPNPMEYRAEIMEVLMSPDNAGKYSTGIIGYLSAIGRPDDAPLLFPHLLDEKRPRVRIGAAEVLAKIGDATTLAAIEELQLALQRVERDEIAGLPALREKYLAQGKSPEQADDLVEYVRLKQEKAHREVARAIETLRTKVEAARSPAETGAGDAGTRPDEAPAGGERAPPTAGQQSRVSMTEGTGENRHTVWLLCAGAIVAATLAVLIFRGRQRSNQADGGRP